MSNGNRETPSRRQQPQPQQQHGVIRRAIKHHGIRHGEKIFVGISLLILLEIGVFTRLYSSLVPTSYITTTNQGQQQQNRRTEVVDNMRPPTPPLRRGGGMAAQQQQQQQGSFSIYEPRRKPTTTTTNTQEGGAPAAPRVVFLNAELTNQKWPSSGTRRTVEALGDLMFHSPDPLDFIDTKLKPFYEQCTPMAEWQTKFYPTCNMIHELPLIDSSDDDDHNNHNNTQEDEAQVTLINSKGSWRSVWKVSQQFREHEDDPPSIVLKTLKLNRDFDYESFYLQNIDSIAMERLTSSPYIANEYGFCGESVLTEYAPASGRDMIKNKKLRTWERVQIAHDLAHALADMHSIDYPNATNPTLTHNDINIANTIMGDRGRIKFNDWNIGVLLRWNGTKPCGYPAQFSGPLWRSPEEIFAFNTSIYIDVAKADVYGLGNVLFQVLTTHQPWTWLEPGGRPSIEQVIEKKLNGSLPFVPAKFHEETTKPGILALYYATISCFAPDPEDRPSSYQLAHALSIALDWAKENKSKTKQQVKELFQFSSTMQSQPEFTLTNTPERRARLLEVSLPQEALVHPDNNEKETTHPPPKQAAAHVSTIVDYSKLSNKTMELLQEKDRQVAAAAAKKRSIERRRKGARRPKIGRMIRGHQNIVIIDHSAENHTITRHWNATTAESAEDGF